MQQLEDVAAKRATQEFLASVDWNEVSNSGKLASSEIERSRQKISRRRNLRRPRVNMDTTHRTRSVTATDQEISSSYDPKEAKAEGNFNPASFETVQEISPP